MDAWEQFEKSGRIEDYLRYKMVYEEEMHHSIDELLEKQGDEVQGAGFLNGDRNGATERSHGRI